MGFILYQLKKYQQSTNDFEVTINEGLASRLKEIDSTDGFEISFLETLTFNIGPILYKN